MIDSKHDELELTSSIDYCFHLTWSKLSEVLSSNIHICRTVDRLDSTFCRPGSIAAAKLDPCQEFDISVKLIKRSGEIR